MRRSLPSQTNAAGGSGFLLNKGGLLKRTWTSASMKRTGIHSSIEGRGLCSEPASSGSGAGAGEGDKGQGCPCPCEEQRDETDHPYDLGSPCESDPEGAQRAEPRGARHKQRPGPPPPS